MKLNRSIWRAFLTVMLVVMPLTAVIVVPAVGAADPVLYDQSSNGDARIWPSNDYVDVIYANFDDMIADDFVVPALRVWTITQVSVFGVPQAGFTHPTSFNVTIRQNAANLPVLWSGTGFAYTRTADRYDIAVVGAPDLSAGTYWLSVQANSTASGLNQSWAWGSRSVQSGAAAFYQNPGNGRGTNCTGWLQRNLCQFNIEQYALSGPDQLFTINGIDQPNDPPVVTVPGARTVNDNVNLTFNAAGAGLISVADPDVNATDILKATVSADHGDITLAAGSGVTPLDSDGDKLAVFTGTLAQINAALNGLVYNPFNGYGGADTLTVTVNDQGSNGTGGAKSDTETIAITVRARTTLSATSATVEYGGNNATLKATLDTTANIKPGTDLSGQTVTFSIGSTVVGTDTTDASGVATLTTFITDPNLNVGNGHTYTASFAGSTYLLPSADASATLQVKRKMLWIKPVDRTIVVKTANPPTTPNADPACAAANRCLELANGSAFAPGDDWSDLNLTNVRFAFNRSGTGPANEKVGAQYRITVAGAFSSNYDIRYTTGTLTTVAP